MRLTPGMASDLNDLLVHAPRPKASPLVEKYWADVSAALRTIAAGGPPVEEAKAVLEHITPEGQRCEYPCLRDDLGDFIRHHEPDFPL